MSRFGEITPAFVAAFGVSVDVGLMLGARNARARALAGDSRHSRVTAHGPPLPVEIPTVRALPPSRVSTAVTFGPARRR